MKKILITLIFIIGGLCQAKTYYVAKTGSNGNKGTLTSPWLTLTYAESKMAHGDTCFIRAGTYNEKLRVSGLTGTATAGDPSVFSTYNEEAVIIDGTGISIENGGGLVRSSEGYVCFLKLIIRDVNVGGDNYTEGGTGFIMDSDSNNNSISRCTIYNCLKSGMTIIGDYPIIEYCTIYNCALSNSDWYEDSAAGETWGAGLSLRTTNGIVEHPIARNNIIHDINGEGLSTVCCNNAIVEDNVIYDTYGVSLYTRNSTYGLFQRNLVYMTKDMGDGPQTGIGHWNESNVTSIVNENNTFVNNIVYGCQRNFYVGNPGMDGLLVANNTFVNSTYLACIQISTYPQISGQFINNLIIQEGDLPCITFTEDADVIFSNNLFNKPYDAHAVGTGDIVGDPKLAKTGETGAGKLTPAYFKLLSTSPAINKGAIIAQVTEDIFGNKRDASPDIGAHEYNAVDPSVKVNSITVNGVGSATTISIDNGTLQLSASVLPANATNKAVTWSLTNGTGQATISTTGLVTAGANGTVTARATAKDGSGIYGALTLTISNQTIAVTGITVTGAGGATTITADNGTLQLSASVLPANATNKAVTWSLTNGTGQATISTTGLVTAGANGTVTARATAKDGSGIYGALTLTISNQTIAVTGITVSGAGGAATITADNGTLQLSASLLPANATNKAVTWSLTNGTGQATISTTGLVTAGANGTVTARATAKDGSGIYGTLTLTISNQTIAVTGITVTGAGGATTITADNGTLQLSAAVLPANATIKAVTWSLTNGTGQATISTTGRVTAGANGTVTARATAGDGSGVVGALTITISNQVIPVIGITVTGAGGASSIFSDNGTLQLSAAVFPANATNKAVTWSLTNGTGQATISNTGLVTAVATGTVTARATAKDGSGVYGILTITISNQIIPVTSIMVTGAGGAATIAADGGTLQLSATGLPANASNKSVTWSITGGSGFASINSSTGLLTATDNGSLTARATANDGSGVYGTLVITISNQVIPVTSITVTGAGGAMTIAADGGTLQLSAAVLPSNATNKTVTWSITNGSGSASINSTTGLVTATDNGSTTVRATSGDGSGIYGVLVIEISNQLMPVVVNTPPVVVVNFDPESYSGFVSEINATGSYDVNKDLLTYTWTVPANIPVSSKSGPVIKYLGPIVNTSQKVEFTLKISDGKTIQSRIIPIEILPFKPELETAEIATIEASGYQSPYYPYNIIDGNIGTMWSANGENQWLTIELKQPFNVHHVKLAFQPGQSRESYFDVLGSEDKVAWESILTKSASCAFSGDLQVFEFPQSKAVKEFNFVKLIGRGNSTDTWNHISELKIFGYPHRNSPEYEKLPVKIYPNPAKDHVTFRIDESTLIPDFIQLINLTGSVIFRSEVDPDIREFTIPINFNKGIYIVQLISGNLTLFTQKLVVK